ncbi:MAG TPA: hypothetical protein VMM93_01420 [Vicinamibacterales bacterium]|nr:hypothetical protein [Vicinamibacterales bacterium]
MNDPREQGQGLRAGLCATCRYARVIVSDRGSLFSFCERSRIDPAFARYPVLPVRVCAGYDATPDAPFPVK